MAKGVEAVVATGSTLANDSVDLIAGLGKPLYLVGPTASVYPAPLFAHGVRGVGGMRIRDVERARR